MSKTVLVLAPHPDDAEFFTGGFLLKLAAEGCRLFIAIATDGCKGTLRHTSQELIPLRRAEAARAAALLGAQEPIFLGHPDFELDALPPGALRAEFLHLIRTIRPDILITQDAWNVTDAHPDHRAVARAAQEALAFSTLPLVHPEAGVEPYFVPEKYFYLPNPQDVNCVVDISAVFERKMAALGAHASQMEFMIEDIFNQARQAGLDPVQILGETALDPLAAMTLAQAQESEEAGKSSGYRYAEAFRMVRFHPLVEKFSV